MTRAPRVSVLVPGFRTDFLRACLDSAVGQSWTDLEVVVGDDCPHDGLHKIVAGYAARDPRVRRLEFEGTGGRENFHALFAAARGEYIKYLNDDDLLHPQCIERMLRCLEAHPEVALVTSHRQRIDASGDALPDTAANRRIVGVDSIVDGRSLIEEMLAFRTNLVGEPTSVMFRRAALAGSQPDLMSFAGRRAAANGDVSMWVTLLEQGDAIYLTKSLSRFRQHDGQRQRDPAFAEKGRRGWEQLCFDARRRGLLPNIVPRGIDARPLGVRPWCPEEAPQVDDGPERVPHDGTIPATVSASRALHGAMDTPVDGGRLHGALTVDGWVLVHPAAMGPKLEIEIEIDGRRFSRDPLRLRRDDVHAVHPELAPFNPLPGFQIPLVLDNLEPGLHRITCSARCGPHTMPLGQARIEVLHAGALAGDSP